MSDFAPATSDSLPTEWASLRVDVLKRIESLPSLAPVVLEFLELTRREFFSARDFERVLAKDQALVARLLKVANSAFYGSKRQVTTIPEAVVMLGFDEMKKIVFAVSTAGWVRRSLRNYDYVEPHGFWLHAMGVGLAARCVAAVARRCPLNEEEIYVAGLLHDIGKPVLDDFLGEIGGTRPVTREDEVAAIGLDHGDLATLILRQWSLPDPLLTAVTEYHLHSRDGGELSRFAAPVRLAHILCSAWKVGEELPMNLSEDVDLAEHAGLLEVLGLPRERVPQLVWDVRQNLVGLEERFTFER